MRNVVNSVLKKMERKKQAICYVRGGGGKRREHAHIYKNICRLLGRKLSKFLLNYFPFLLEVGKTKSLGMMEDVVR